MMGWLEEPVKNIYAATNEDLCTIVTALAPTPKDTILAICGSGDQGVALALHGARVICVDVNSTQLEYASRRYGSLLRGDKRSFLLPVANQDESWLGRSELESQISKRNGYFLAQNNFDDVSRIGSVSFEERDIVDALRSHPECTKVYVSNALHYGDDKICRKFVDAALERCRLDSTSPMYYDARALDTIRS